MRQRTFLLAAFAASAVHAQFQDNAVPRLSCDGARYGEAHRTCEMREEKIPVSQKIEINAGPNGGVTVNGWSRPEIWVRARVEASSQMSEAEAKAMAAQVRVVTSAGRIESAGPESRDGKWWSVSYEVFVPHRIDVGARTVNGGVTFQDLDGRLAYSTVNGGVNLARVAGEVKGHTVNGGLNVELAGASWTGAGLDVSTTNGGVIVKLPANYSARLDVGTVNGGVSSDFGLPAQAEPARRRKQVEMSLGAGGAPLRVRTTNGAVRLKKA